MGWDGVDMVDEQGHRRAAADVLTAEFSGQDRMVVAVDADVAKGRAYLAVRGADGQVRPVCLLLDPVDESDPAHPFLYYKDFPVDESSRRWPAKVAQALTTWEP
jgi:peptidyl-tRNA hydrolase